MFNKETEYALRGLVYIDLQNMGGRRPGTLEIAREIEAPPFYIAKIFTFDNNRDLLREHYPFRQKRFLKTHLVQASLILINLIFR